MLLKGKDLVPAIKEQQKAAVTKLRQQGTVPRLAIIQAIDDPVINTYVGKKRQYGADIGVIVDIHKLTQKEIATKLQKLNADSSVHAIIIQLPLENMDEADELLALVNPHKDVDGLGPKPDFEPATATAIINLLAGYRVELKGKSVVVVGRGRLVGAPLKRMLDREKVEAAVVHSQTENPETLYQTADVIITATGQPGLIKSKDIRTGTVVVDAGTAGEGGKTVGDLTKDIVERKDIKVSPTPGGVGPLTVCALFENVLKAAQAS